MVLLTWIKLDQQLTTLTQLQPALLRLEHLYYRSSHFWLLRWLTPMSATRRVHRLKSSWTNTWRSSSRMEKPMASNFGWIVRLCTTVLRHWRWTCCRHQHQKHNVERIFSLCGMLTAGRRNRLKKNLEMRVFLKLNNNILSWMLTVL